MVTPGRRLSNGSSYRYGFNGQENTKELGESFYEAEYWQYDSRIGRRWNIDPVPKIMFSPYAVLANNPILLVDPDGADWYHNKKTHETQWFDNRRDARKAGFKNFVNNRWLAGDKPNTWVWHGNTKADVVQYAGELEPVVVSAKAKQTSLIDKTALGKGINNSVNEYPKWKAGYDEYFIRKRDKLPILQAGDDAYYASQMGSYERHWQAYQDWRVMSGVAAGALTGPVSLTYAGFAVPSVVGYVSSLELPSLYTEVSLYSWRTTTLFVNSTKNSILLGVFGAANHYMPYSLKRSIVKQLNTPLPNVVTPQIFEKIVEQFVPGPTMKK